MGKTAESVWKNCLKFVKDNIQEQAFETWFSPIQPIKLNENILTIQVPSKFFYEWLEEHYIKLLKIALQKELGKDAKLVYSIVMDQKYSGKDPYTVRIPSSNKEKLQPQEIDAPLPIDSKKVKNPFVIPGLQKIKIDSQLNTSNNFSNFIEGETNRLARSAGKAVAKRPGGTSFNPLFIYGGVGLGKTHLAHAIGLEAKENHPDKTVLYVSTEKFTQQFIDAVQSNNRNDFIHFYQMIDILIIDDVQFLSGKKGTQEAFFHIFNHLHQKGNQIILTSDKPPVDIQDMEQRLISRFKWGLSADLQVPDYETRFAILKHKVEKDGIEIPEEVIDHIAKSIKTNVRELEGCLNSIIAQATLNKKEITLELTQKTLANFINHTRKEISIDYIQRLVCDYFKIPFEQIQSKTRKRDVVQARQLAMFFAKKYTKASLSSIGSQIGKRDHATVLHACKTVKNLSETDKVFRGYVEDLNRKIGVE
ncbi:MAG: chromosomal replication initiator protein DnaA [Flavobacteriaceae bacterium]|nr:chromosomal replication initiator protein DnaA [Flavobacteriaceae bacterium]